MNATLKNAMQAAAQKQEQYCSARTHEASAAYAEAQLTEAEECYAESGELFEERSRGVSGVCVCVLCLDM